MTHKKYDQTNGSNSNFREGPKDHSPAPSGETQLQLEMPISEAMEECELMCKVNGKAKNYLILQLFLQKDNDYGG